MAQNLVTLLQRPIRTPRIEKTFVQKFKTVTIIVNFMQINFMQIN